MTTPHRARWGRRIVAGLSLLLLVAGGVGHTVIGSMSERIDRVDAFHGLDDRPGGSNGLNFLVVGTDRRDDVSAAAKARYRLGGAPCNCTDTIMLVHVSADRRRASVVSIPRDTYVRFPRSGAHTPGGPLPRAGKINQAYQHGGPPQTVRTVERLTGVHIDHYLEVDFTGFMKTVDVIGGVKVCSSRPLNDAYSGLKLPAGTSELDGGEALQYVRARHVDGASDLSRMKRQQRFLAAVVDKATGSAGLLNPARFRQVTGAVLDSVRADHGFGSQDMFALGEAMRGFTPRSSEFTSVPIANPSYQVPGVGTTVLWDKRKAAAVFAKIRADKPLAVRKGPGRAHPTDPPLDGADVHGGTVTGDEVVCA